MSTKPTVYLAGPITGLTYRGATDWRNQVKYELAPDVIGASPMRGKDYLAALPGLIGGSPEEAYMKEVISSQRGILGRDRNDVRTADVVLMNVLGAKIVSIGTMIEAGWADAYRIPIVLVMEPGVENVHNHVMLDGLATYRLDNLQDAVHLIRILLNVPAYQTAIGNYDANVPASLARGPSEPITMTPLAGGGL